MMRVALALGSGGARGYAHIGVVEELRHRGHQVVAVAGTSMGALVGGLVAADRLDPFTEWVTGLSQRDVWRLFDPSLGGPGMIKADKILSKVSQILDGDRIEDLPIPFTAVATDLDSRREVWFQQGPLDAAIRASIAIPSFITPVVINGRTLADGGVLNPVPMEATFGAAADLTLAVDVTASPAQERGAPVPESSQPSGAPLQRIRRRLTNFERGWWPRWNDKKAPAVGAADASREEPLDAGFPAPPPVELVIGTLPKNLRVTDVMMQSLDAMQSMITRYRMAANPPDVHIEISSNVCGTLDFHRATEMIELGRARAIAALDAAGC